MQNVCNVEMSDVDQPRRVSAVIRALNEGQHIGRLLRGLEQQTVKPDEIILVDSGSTDDTVAIAKAAGCTVVRIAKNEFSFGRALNRGALQRPAIFSYWPRRTFTPFTTLT